MGIIESNYKSKIDNFINEMDKIPDNEYFHQNSDKFSELLIDVVHAIADCYERNRDKLGSTDKDFICAFRYLNNQLKHDTNLDVFDVQFHSAVLPTYLPCILEAAVCSIRWADFEDHGRPVREGTRLQYDTYLKDEDVVKTLKDVKQILDGVVN
ncbi:MAG: hypothetical protein E7489_07545 [Ruminococcaceae bacterium]|nr:hypothetical protein [Oscillospiraceae bacterium]